MPATVADRSSIPVVYAQIQGVGPLTAPLGTEGRWRFASREPSVGAFGAQWRPYLVDVPQISASRLDPVTGEVEPGGLVLDLLDGPQAATLTDVFAVRRTDDGRGWLAANVAVGAATIDVTRDIGVPAQFDVVWLGAEAMRVSGVALGGGVGGSDRLTVTKGWYGTRDESHAARFNGGDGEVRYRPHFMLGRIVELWLNFDAGGQVDGDAQQIGTYVLERLAFVDGTTWRLTLRGVESLLQTEVGQAAFHGWAPNVFSPRAAVGVRFDRDAFAEQDVGLMMAAFGQTENVSPDAAWGGYLRYDDACVEYDWTTGFGGEGRVLVEITDWHIARTPLPTSDEIGVWVREVLPTDRGLPHGRFAPIPSGGAATTSDHPIDIFLCLALSTGLGTNVVAGQTNYDVLPASPASPLRADYGAGIPVARFDIGAWESMKRRTFYARVPNLVIGWDGPFALLDFAQRELLGPLGIAAVADEHGLISPVRVSEVFPSATPTDLGSDDILAGTETWEMSLDGQVQTQSWKLDHNGPDGDPGSEYSVRSPESLERFRDGEDRGLEIEARGWTVQSGAMSVVLERAEFLLRHFLEPPPRFTVSLNWHQFWIPLGGAVTLTYAVPPNPVTGARGFASLPAIVLSRRPVLRDVVQGGHGGGVEVELFLVGLDSPTLCLWASSAVVGTLDAGTGVVVTVVENSFSDGTASEDGTVADDTDGFQAGAVGTGCYVILIDSDGALQNANTPRVIAKTATTLTLSDVFRDGGGVEVARAVGDVVIYSGDTGAASYPAQAWTTYMQQHGAWVDAATGTVGGTTRTAQWGD